MILKRHAPFVTLLLLTLAVFGLVATMTVKQVAAIGLADNAPSAANSGPNRHVFYLRNASGANGGSQKTVTLNAYYTSWSGTPITIDPGYGANTNATDGDKSVCSTNTNAYNVVDDAFVSVVISDSSDTRTYFIKKANVCRQPSSPNYQNVPNATGSDNQLYGSYGLPSPPAVDAASGLYKVTISISYSNSVPDDAGGIRLKVSSPGGIVGQGGGASHSFPISASWADHIGGGGVSHIYVSFGLDCNASAAVTQKIGVYDADNGTGGFADNVYFKVKNADTGDYVKLTSPQNVSGATTDTRIVPANGSSAFSGALVTINPHTKYILEVEGIDTNNTIDLRLPDSAESIFGSDNFDFSARCGGKTGTASTQTVYVTPGINAQADDVEVGDPVTFNQSASVTNSVALRLENWGYRAKAEQNSTSANVNWRRDYYTADNVDYQNPNASQGVCTQTKNTGTARNPKYVCFKWNWSCSYSRWGGGGTTFYRTSGNAYGEDWSGLLADRGNAPDCPPAHRHQCKNGGADYWNLDSNGSCDNKWVCISPTQGQVDQQFNNSNISGNDCRVFNCVNASDAQGFQVPAGNQPKDRCRYRCPLGNGIGNGAFAPLSQSDSGSGIDTHSAGDLNCYLSPALQFYCQFDNGGPTVGPITAQWTYDQNTGSYSSAESNSYCAGLPGSSTSRTGTGSQVCATSSVVPGSLQWISDANHEHPGYGFLGGSFYERVHWAISVGAPASTCQNVGTKPYLKVFHGAVKSGKYLLSQNGQITCASGNGNIQAWNRGGSYGYAGSGTTDGVVALGNIDGFRSASTQTTLSSKGLTFANTDATAYGGHAGGFDEDCAAYSTTIASAHPYQDSVTTATLGTPGVPTTITANGVGITAPTVGQGGTYVHHGDLYIAGDSYYTAAGVSNLIDLPNFTMIVLGNIYIAPNVRHLSGSYVAISTDGNNGNVFTCADPGVAVRASDRLGRCNSSLTVDGSLNARSVKFLRTNNTLRDSSGDQPNNPAATSAAEIINYGPEGWLPESDTQSRSYQSITSLPPIL